METNLGESKAAIDQVPLHRKYSFTRISLMFVYCTYNRGLISVLGEPSWKFITLLTGKKESA